MHKLSNYKIICMYILTFEILQFTNVCLQILIL